MRQSIRLGKVAGIPVGIHWSVIIIVGLIAGILGGDVLPAMVPGQSQAAYWAVGISGALLFVVALFAHELAHAVVARRAHVEVRSITLWGLGGVSELGGDPPTPRTDLAIAVAGPAISLVAAVVFGGIAVAVSAGGGPGIAVAALVWLALMNGLLAVFNLLPGAPLDGGRILRAVLWMRHGDRARAARTAAGAGRVLGIALVGFGVFELLVRRDAGGLWIMLIGVFLASAASAEGAAEAAATTLGDVRVRDVMTANPAMGAGWMSVSDFADRIALHSTQTVFPVIGFDGALVGVVDLDTLARVPGPARSETLLQDIAVPVPPAYRARPDDPVKPLLARRPLGRHLLAIVSEEDRIVGMVTADALRQAVMRARLGDRPLHESRA